MSKYFCDPKVARRVGALGGRVKRTWSPARRQALVAKLNEARRRARPRRVKATIAEVAARLGGSR